jgi:DNA-binding LytR/AlgR family response regulator
MYKCIVVDDDHIIRRLIEEFVKKTNKIELLGSYDNPVQALSELVDEGVHVDIVFLDVEMPEMNGLELIDNIRSKPQIIIISGKEEYALDAFDYAVTDYLLKPITYARFFKAVNRAIDNIKTPEKEVPKSDNKDAFFIRDNSNLVRIKFSEIRFIEAQENYVSLQLGNKRHLIHYTMKAIENEVPSDKFIRVHRSYFVNRDYISQISGNRISMKLQNETMYIPIGRSYKDKLLDTLNLIS